MATIRLTANERPRALAHAVIHEQGIRAELRGLAEALSKGDGKRFDEILNERFTGTALDLAGLGPAGTSEVGVTGEPPREAERDTGVEAE